MKKVFRKLAMLSVAMLLGFASCEKGSDQEQNMDNSGGGSTTNVINGHEYVDLGLPSGLKWATCNVGATTPEGYGNYYAWGETTTKSSYTRDNSLTYGKDMGDISGNVNYDAATANWGGSWRMPTIEEMVELWNCTWIWTTQNGVSGVRITGQNGNSIFLPAAGYCYESLSCRIGEGCYWSSTPHGEDSTTAACGLHILEDEPVPDVNVGVDGYFKYVGLPVRPVSD